MKPFNVYQYLEGEEMTERDKMEVGSKFWNKGKWDNFVLPFLPQDCSDMTFIDMGCNKGLFLNLAQEKGFRNVIGVDGDKDAVEKGILWRDRHGKSYKLLNLKMEECIDQLPLADYTVFANSHYYFTVNDWTDYLDVLQYKTRYVIIVTAEKRHLNRCWASAGLDEIRSNFRFWKEVRFIDELPIKDDPMPRRLWGLCFESPHLERIEINKLDSSNHVQDSFWGELDNGIDYHKTHYYRILIKYRRHWGVEKLDKWMEERIRIYKDLKENGLKKPILVDSGILILDGNHRYSGLKHLGYKNIIIRRV